MEGKIISLIDLQAMIHPEITQEGVPPLVYKTAYRLRSNDMLTPIRSGLYCISNGKKMSDFQIIDLHYWRILKKILQEETRGDYFIAGNKSLEVLLKDYSIPSKVIVYTKDIQKNIRISSSHVVSLRKVVSWKKTGLKNAFSEMKKFTKSVDIEGEKIKVAREELALLDSFIVHDNEERIDMYLIGKFIKKYSKNLDRTMLWSLVSFRYITSMNRLREYARDHGENNLYALALDIVKKEGGNCFLTGK